MISIISTFSHKGPPRILGIGICLDCIFKKIRCPGKRISIFLSLIGMIPYFVPHISPLFSFWTLDWKLKLILINWMTVRIDYCRELLRKGRKYSLSPMLPRGGSNTAAKSICPKLIALLPITRLSSYQPVRCLERNFQGISVGGK